MDKNHAVVIKGVVRSVFHNTQVQECLEGLYQRWQDERGYEKVGDYVAVMGGVVDNVGGLVGGVTFVKMMARPFGFVFRVTLTDGVTADFIMSVNSKGFRVQNV